VVDVAPPLSTPARRSSALTEWLGQVVIRTQLERPHKVGLFTARCQHHDRGGAFTSNHIAQVKAGSPGQINV
jgi:hypothetical protein